MVKLGKLDKPGKEKISLYCMPGIALEIAHTPRWEKDQNEINFKSLKTFVKKPNQQDIKG